MPDWLAAKDWIDKARRSVAGTPTPVETEPFERPCVCGAAMTGLRRRSAQEVPCPACGRPWFLLPIDPYPRPRPKRKPSPNGNGKKKGTAAPAAAPRPSPTAETAGNAGATAAETPAPAKPKPPEPPASRPPLAERLLAVAREAKTRAVRGARPTRLIAAVILGIVLLTGYRMWRQSRLDAAAATLTTALPEAERALVGRDFVLAGRLFGDAADAAERLDAADAARLRQKSRELAAINGLAAQTPFDLAAEAERLASSPGRWGSQFASADAGRWVLLDVSLSSPEPSAATKPAEDETPGTLPPQRVVRLGLPLVAGDRPVRFEVDAAAIAPLGPHPSRAVLAAQYESWTPYETAAGRDGWLVRFRPDVVLWTSPDLLAALGLDPDDATAGEPLRAALERQAEALGLSDDVTKKRGTAKAPSSPRTE